jgi:hypothetical protein
MGHARAAMRARIPITTSLFFLKGPTRLWRESERLADLETTILYDSGAIINALPFTAETYGARTPLMHELRRDGRDL